MKSILFGLFYFLLSFNLFSQTDSINIAAVSNVIIEESNQFRVLVYLYRISNGISPKDFSDFHDFLDSKNYPSGFKYISNISFFDTNKVSYDFNLDEENGLTLNDSLNIVYIDAHVTADYLSDFMSTIHSFESEIDSAVVINNNIPEIITDQASDTLFIRLEKEDLLSINSNIKNIYEPDTPEFLVLKSVECLQNQDWITFADILYPADLELMKSAFDYIVKEEKIPDLTDSFENINTKEEFLELSPKEFVPEFMNFLYSVSPQYAYAFQNIQVEIVGKISEKEMIHVLAREKINLMGKNVERLEVNTVIKVGDKFYLKLQEELRSFIDQLR